MAAIRTLKNPVVCVRGYYASPVPFSQGQDTNIKSYEVCEGGTLIVVIGALFSRTIIQITTTCFAAKLDVCSHYVRFGQAPNNRFL